MKKMNTTKKIVVALAVMMVAAAMAAPAAMGDEATYTATVCAHQSTAICCGPDGAFGEILQGGISNIVGTFGLKNIGGWDAEVSAAFTTQAVGGDHGLVKVDDNTVAISASNFKLQQSGDESDVEGAPCNCVASACCPGGAQTNLLDNGDPVLIPGIVPRDGACCRCYDAELLVPGATAPGAYQGTVLLTFGNA